MLECNIYLNPGHKGQLSNDYSKCLNRTLEKSKLVESVVSMPAKKSEKAVFLLHRIKRRKQSIIVTSWDENILRNCQSKISFLGIVKYLVFMLLCRACSRSLIRVNHNRYPHGLASEHRKIFSWIYKISQFIVTDEVYHSPVPSQKSGFYISHPLYDTTIKLENVLGEIKNAANTPFLLIFGRVESYKNIPNFINLCSKNQRIIIAGRCNNPKLQIEISKIISERNVIWFNEYISQNDLNYLISRSEGVVISQQDSNNYVSGNFFHAASFGQRIYAVRNEFLSHVEKNAMYRQLIAFDSIEELSTNIKVFSVGRDEPSRLLEARNDAENNFGIDRQVTHWNELFTKL